MNEIINDLFKTTQMKKKKNKLETIRTLVKKCTFDLFYILLKKQSHNNLVEILSLIIQLFQVLSFPLHPKVNNYLNLSLEMFENVIPFIKILVM